MDTILVPVDGSECSLHALDVAVDLARKLSAETVICTVVDLGKAAAMSGAEPLLLKGCYEELQEEGEYVLEQAKKRAGSTVAISTRTGEGAPIDEIVRIAADLKPQFVVIGSHGRGGVNRFVMGSVAEGVARHSPVPVMIVPINRHAEIAHSA